MTTRLPVHRTAILALVLAAAARAQEPLFAPPIHPSVNNIRGATPGDVNEDGFPDLVVWANGPAVMLNQAGAGFAAPVTVAGAAVSLHLADLNHDGHLDLIGVNAFDDVIKVALGAGNGSFGAFTDTATAADLRDVAVGDFDGDGHLDVAAAGLHSGRVSVHLGAGDGTLGPKQDYGPIGDYASAITAADLTGDGVLDLAVAIGNESEVALLFGDGDGTFTVQPPLVLPGPTEDVAALDLDDDGDLDLVVAMVASVELRAVFNNGGGGFSHSSFPYELPSSVNSLLVAADFDEDGRQDIAIGIGADDLVTVFRSTGLPGAGTLELMGTYFAGRSPQGLSCADVDLDGDLDLVAADIAGNEVRILRGEGDGSFRTAAGPWPAGVQALTVAAGDLDEDGRPDLVACGTGSSLNAGDGRFPQVSAWPVPSGTRPDAVVADFNGDGHLDVATANSAFGPVSATIVLGDGDGNPLAMKHLLNAGAWSWIDAADFDGDGDLDLVLGPGGTSGAAVVLVAFNDGSGGLTAAPQLDTEWFSAMGVCARDFNGDGAPDIAVAHDTFAGRISVFLGDGAGGFTEPVATEIKTTGGQRDLAAADFDGDGILDLAVTSYYSQFAVHLGHGNGTFGDPVLYGFLNNTFGLAIGDVDHDGIDDLVTADNHQFGTFGTLSVLTGHGDGSFEPAVSFKTGASPWQVAIADLDGDGWNDVATAPFGGTDVLLNRRGPWNELGHGLAGTQGIPRQTGNGTLVPGQPFKFTLRDARPFTTAYHVVGLSLLNHAFKGGVMVPSIDFINPFPVTNGQGTAVLAGPWINVPSGLTLYFQFWLPDPNGPFNFEASTAISGTTP
jgi:hypothetical protein